MNRKEYFALYKDIRWQKKRLEIYERDGWRCSDCRTGETHEVNTLHVHHLYYETGNLPWEYPNSALITLCEECHETETESMKEATYKIAQELKKLGFRASDIYDLAESFQVYREQELESDKNTMKDAAPDDAEPSEYLRDRVKEILFNPLIRTAISIKRHPLDVYAVRAFQVAERYFTRFIIKAATRANIRLSEDIEEFEATKSEKGAELA